MQTYSFAVGLLLGFSWIPHLVQAAPSSLGPLSSYIQADSSDGWTVSDDGSAAYLENQQSSGAIRYYYIYSPPEDEGTRSISVDVGFGSSTSQSLAGLLYAYRENPKTYFLVTVGGDQTINIHEWIDGGLEELLKTPVPTLTAEKTTLHIQEQGNSVTVSINGTVFDTFTDSRLGRGGVGIVASDVGQFKFSNFSVKKSTATGTIVSPEVSVSPEKIAAVPETSVSPTKITIEQKQPRDEETKKYFPSPDQRFNGMVSNYIAYPASWKQLTDNKEFLYEGPNGVKVSGAFGRMNQFSTNPDGLQMLQMQG